MRNFVHCYAGLAQHAPDQSNDDLVCVLDALWALSTMQVVHIDPTGILSSTQRIRTSAAPTLLQPNTLLVAPKGIARCPAT